MRRLNPSDDRWLATESSANPFQIAGLLLCRATDATAAASFGASVREHLRQRLPFTPLAVRHVDAPWHLEPGVWVGVDDIDIDRQVMSHPGPLRRDELHRFVATEVMRRWDPGLAPFRCTVFELLDDDVAPGMASDGALVGLFLQTHHSVVDGVGFQHVVEDLTDPLDGAPEPRDRISGVAERPPNRLAWTAGALRRAARARRAWAAGAPERERAQAALDALKADPAARRARTPTLAGFEVDRYEARTYERMELDLPALKAVGKALGGTVNDAMMTILSGALRRLLDRRGLLAELGPQPLVALVPRSVRTEADGRYGNHFTMMLPQLATQVADPVARFAAVRASMRAEIARNDLSAQLTRSTDRLRDAHRRRQPTEPAPAAGNVSLSNVPGPAAPRHLAGYELLANYPGPNLVPGQLVNITLRRYVDRLCLGVLTDRGVLPDLGELIDDVRASEAELAAAAVRV